MPKLAACAIIAIGMAQGISLAAAGTARAAELQSVSKIAFGPPGILFVADWKAGKIDAIALPPAANQATAPFNALDLDPAIRAAFGTDAVTVAGLAQRPGTDEVYVALSIGPTAAPAILVITPDGHARALDLPHASATTMEIKDAPTSQYSFWNRTPMRSFTVTDMKWHRGKLFVAGLSNQTFSSSLRIVAYPFAGAQSITSIAMYHATHNQMETRAPIRAMSFATLAGQDTLVAAYLCSPLVTIPVASLTDGAHVEGKTIAEFGYGNTANAMVSYTSGAPGKAVPYILVTNDQRSANLLSVAAVEKANAAPGLSKAVPFGSAAGVSGVVLPFAGVMAMDNQDDRFLVALRRDLASGHLQLVSYDKTFNFRVSDFISEYDFPGYRYTPGFETQEIKPVVTRLEREEGFPGPT